MRQCANNCGYVTWVHPAKSCSLSSHFCCCSKQRRQLVPINQPITCAATKLSALCEPNFGNFPSVVARISGGPQSNITHGLVADLRINDICADKTFSVAWTKWIEIHVPRPEPSAGTIKRHNASSVYKDASTLAGGHKSQDLRRCAPASGHDNDVVNAANSRTARVKQGESHDAKCVDEVACHAARVPPRVGLVAVVIASVSDSGLRQQAPRHRGHE